MQDDPVVIASYARTPMGSFQGSLAGASATQLGATAVGAAVERAGLSGEAIERIYMGCVLPAGLGQAPARQAALGAGLPQHIEATTVNKMCGSGMQAVMMAADTIAASSADIIVAGGMESMTNAPYLSQRHRSGARIGHDRLIDHMYMDGLEDAYEPGRLMGSFAEETAVSYGFTREAQDAFAIESLTRAQAAQTSGAFDREIVPVEIAGRKGPTTVRLDEQPARGDGKQLAAIAHAIGRGPGCLYVYSGSDMLYSATGRCLMSRYLVPSHLIRAREAGATGVDQDTEIRRILTARPAVVVVRPFYSGERPAAHALVAAALARNYRLTASLPMGNEIIRVYHRAR